MDGRTAPCTAAMDTFRWGSGQGGGGMPLGEWEHNNNNEKYWHIWDINIWNFDKMLTYDVMSFERLGPDSKEVNPFVQSLGWYF